MTSRPDCHPAGAKRLRDLLSQPPNGARRIPVGAQVEPACVSGFNQALLSASRPAFKLLLSGDRHMPVRSLLEVNKSRDVILPRKSRHGAALVLPHALLQVACNADVQTA